MTDALLASLRSGLGPDHVLTDGDLGAYLNDWRGRWKGRALAVVRPANTQQVAEVLRACHEAGVPVVPQGGNTGLVGGGVPDDSGRQILLSLQRLRQVRSVDPDNLTMTVDAGCVLSQAQQAAADQGLLLPLSLAAEGSCTIGGNLATNAGGTQVLRYGNARELCLGLEVVTPDGRIWTDLAGLRKDNTGYCLRHLYIGSEGTLGVITAATLRLYPQPAARVTALASCDTLTQALTLLNLARAHAHDALTAFEVMNTLSLKLVARHFPALASPLPDSPWTVLLELSDGEGSAHAAFTLERILEQALEKGTATDAVVAQSLTQSRVLWHMRESISLAQSQEGLNLKHDISVPISAMASFVERTDAELAAALPGARMVTFGHLGDGNLHYNVQAPEGIDASRFLIDAEDTANRIVYDAVARHGGSISAEHGIGQLKREELALRKAPVALDLMRTLKSALDPKGLMNPGRLL